MWCFVGMWWYRIIRKHVFDLFSNMHPIRIEITHHLLHMTISHVFMIYIYLAKVKRSKYPVKQGLVWITSYPAYFRDVPISSSLSYQLISVHDSVRDVRFAVHPTFERRSYEFCFWLSFFFLCILFTGWWIWLHNIIRYVEGRRTI